MKLFTNVKQVPSPASDPVGILPEAAGAAVGEPC